MKSKILLLVIDTENKPSTDIAEVWRGKITTAKKS
jgi:hypothetical protein